MEEVIRFKETRPTEADNEDQYVWDITPDGTAITVKELDRAANLTRELLATAGLAHVWQVAFRQFEEPEDGEC